MLIHITAPIPVLEYIILSIKIQPWLSGGKTFVKDINVINPTYNHYETLQVKHLLNERDIRSIEVNKEILQELQDRPYKKGGISRLYAHLHTGEGCTKTAHMLTWEKDLGLTFSCMDWKQARGTPFKASRCVNH